MSIIATIASSGNKIHKDPVFIIGKPDGFYYSTDGYEISFYAPYPLFGIPMSIVYGKDKFVGLINGNICFSDDLLTWTIGYSSGLSNSSGQYLQFINNLFVLMYNDNLSGRSIARIHFFKNNLSQPSNSFYHDRLNFYDIAPPQKLQFYPRGLSFSNGFYLIGNNYPITDAPTTSEYYLGYIPVDSNNNFFQGSDGGQLQQFIKTPYVSTWTGMGRHTHTDWMSGKIFYFKGKWITWGTNRSRFYVIDASQSFWTEVGLGLAPGVSPIVFVDDNYIYIQSYANNIIYYSEDGYTFSAVSTATQVYTPAYSKKLQISMASAQNIYFTFLGGVSQGQWTTGFYRITTPPPTVENVDFLVSTTNNLSTRTVNQIFAADVMLAGGKNMKFYDPGFAQSIVFGGNANSKINYESNPAQSLGSGDFTVEWWQYETDNNGAPRPWATGAWPNSTQGCSMEGNSFYWWGNGGVVASFQFKNPVKNAGNHFAVTRKNGTLRVFQNGRILGSTQDSTNYETSLEGLTLGSEGGYYDSQCFQGYMADFRISQGIARYTQSFSPPTRPVGVDSYTTFYVPGVTNDNTGQEVVFGNSYTIMNTGSSTNSPYKI